MSTPMSSRAVSEASVLLRVPSSALPTPVRGRENAFMHTAFSDRQGCPACFCPPLPYKSFIFLKKSGIVPSSLGTPGDTRGSFLRGPCQRHTSCLPCVFFPSSVSPPCGHRGQGTHQPGCQANVQGQLARESKSLLPWH